MMIFHMTITLRWLIEQHLTSPPEKENGFVGRQEAYYVGQSTLVSRCDGNRAYALGAVGYNPSTQ